jgi:hypothetical protein
MNPQQGIGPRSMQWAEQESGGMTIFVIKVIIQILLEKKQYFVSRNAGALLMQVIVTYN